MQLDIFSLFAMLLPLIASAGAQDFGLNLPKDLVLKQGDQIVAIGDSITQAGGYLRDVDTFLAVNYPELKLPKIINVGIGGQKAEDLIKRFQKDIIDKKPAVVSLSIGINDVWHRADKPHDSQVLADYWNNVDAMVNMAQEAKIRVILLTPTLIHEDLKTPENQRLKIYVEAEKQIAQDRKCTLIDMHRLFNVAIEHRPKDVSDPTRWLTSDGVHMKAEGDALMAIGMLRGLGIHRNSMKKAQHKPTKEPEAKLAPVLVAPKKP